MSKDLSKEYKEAVLNDLPDLWGRIEAAIDAEEAQSAKTEDHPVEKPVNVVEFKSVEKNVNENKAAKQKKKFKIPAWVMISLPTVAILLIIVIPVAALGVLGLVFSASGTKNSASDIAYCAEPSAAASDPMEMRDEVDSSYDRDSWDYEASYETTEGEDPAAEPVITEEDEDFKDFTYNLAPGASEDDDNGRQAGLGQNNKKDVPGMVSDSTEELPHSVDSYLSDEKVKFKNEWLYLYTIEDNRNNLNNFIANEDLVITVDNMYMEGADYIAECTIIEKNAEDNPIYHGFPGLDAGDSFVAHFYEPFEVGKKYKVALVLVSNLGEDQYFEIWQLEE